MNDLQPATAETFADLATGAVIPMAAQHAAETLVLVARQGDVAATIALLAALATSIGYSAAVVPIREAGSVAALVADGRIPPLLRVAAAALCKRDFLLDDLSALVANRSSLDDGVRGLQAMIVRDDALADEALRAFAFFALATLIETTRATATDRTLGAGVAGIHGLVERQCRIVPGHECDSQLRFGRDTLLGARSAVRLVAIVHHEFGHLVLDATWGRRLPALEPPVALTLDDLAAALPGLVAAALAAGRSGLKDDDPRRLVLASGLAVLVTARDGPDVPWLHLSFARRGSAPLPFDDAARATRLVTLHFDANLQYTLAYTRAGLLHVGILDGPAFAVALAAPSDRVALARRAADEGPAWLHDLSASPGIGDREDDLAEQLGIVPEQPALFTAREQPNLSDQRLCGYVREQPDLATLDARMRVGAIAAAWRVGDPSLLGRLAAMEGATFEARPLAELGTSSAAARSRSQTAWFAPSLATLEVLLRMARDAGADIDAPVDDGGATLLAQAVARDAVAGEARHTGALVALGADVDRIDAAGDTPLIRAAVVGATAAARVLLAAGADARVAGRDRTTALARAIAGDRDDVAAALLDAGAPVDARDGSGRTPLAAARTPLAVNRLIEAGASVDATALDGATPLIDAARADRVDVVAALLARGANPRHADALGETAAYWAAGSVACLTALVDGGADLDDSSGDGVTPLMHAAANALATPVRWLAAHGASIDAADGLTGRTALHLAADSRNALVSSALMDRDRAATVRALLDAGAEVDADDDDGITALMLAVDARDPTCVRTLVERGASPHGAARDGTSAWTRAAASGDAALASALQQGATAAR